MTILENQLTQKMIICNDFKYKELTDGSQNGFQIAPYALRIMLLALVYCDLDVLPGIDNI